MTLLSILALGFFLGMRHATDSDHVVAVTTIVSGQRKIGSAALTGVRWPRCSRRRDHSLRDRYSRAPRNEFGILRGLNVNSARLVEPTRV